MKLYIVFRGEYDDHHIEQIFTIRAKAEEWLKYHPTNEDHPAQIEEFETNDQYTPGPWYWRIQYSFEICGNATGQLLPKLRSSYNLGLVEHSPNIVINRGFAVWDKDRVMPVNIIVSIPVNVTNTCEKDKERAFSVGKQAAYELMDTLCEHFESNPNDLEVHNYAKFIKDTNAALAKEGAQFEKNRLPLLTQKELQCDFSKD